MYKGILEKKGILNKREYLELVWPADVWPADDIHLMEIKYFISIFTIHDSALILIHADDDDEKRKENASTVKQSKHLRFS